MNGSRRSGIATAPFLLIALVIVAAILPNNDLPALAQETAGPFTQAQATAGREDFLGNCASCHGAALAGAGDAPPLTGPNFAADWSARTTHEFYLFISTAMPEGLEGDLGSDTYCNIIAFLLAANGAKPGPAPFTKDTSVKIGTIANSQMVPAVVAGSGR